MSDDQREREADEAMALPGSEFTSVREWDAAWSPELFGLTADEYARAAHLLIEGDGLTNPYPGKIVPLSEAGDYLDSTHPRCIMAIAPVLKDEED